MPGALLSSKPLSGPGPLGCSPLPPLPHLVPDKNKGGSERGSDVAQCVLWDGHPLSPAPLPQPTCTGHPTSEKHPWWTHPRANHELLWLCLSLIMLGLYHASLSDVRTVSCYVVVQSLSRVWLFATPWTTAHQASLSLTISQRLLKLMSIESVMPSSVASSSCLQSFPTIRVFSSESALWIRWPKYRSFSFSISPSHEYSGLISFRMDWFDLLAVQGTLKSLLQHHSSKASILQCSAFFTVQVSHPYMTTGKTIALTIQIFVGQSNVSAF